jgi:hypothetical protein
MGPNCKIPVWSQSTWWPSSHICAANFDLSKYPCLMLYSHSFILRPSGPFVQPIHSLPRLHGILNIHCHLCLNSIFGFIFHKRPLWYFLFCTVFVLNLFPILLIFSDSPLMYGIDTTHIGLVSLHFCFLSWGFLLITIYHFFWVCIN